MGEQGGKGRDTLKKCFKLVSVLVSIIPDTCLFSQLTMLSSFTLGLEDPSLPYGHFRGS